MRKSRFSEEQIIGVLKAVESGQKVADVCRQQGISEGTYFRWRAKYGGLEVSEARRLPVARGGESDHRQQQQLVGQIPAAGVPSGQDRADAFVELLPSSTTMRRPGIGLPGS